MSVSQMARPRSGAATPEDILARIERLPLSSWQIMTRIIVGTATFFDAFDALSIAYVLPVIVPLWKLAPGQIGTLISFGFLGQLIGALIGGALAERFGRRPVIVVAVLWFGLMSLACGFAWSYQSLLVLRLLQGLGLGAEVPVAATYISELAKAGGRGHFVLLFELVFPLGLVAAAVLGRWIVPTLGWQYLFFVGGVPALFALLMMRNLPESPRWLAAPLGRRRRRHRLHREAGRGRDRQAAAAGRTGVAGRRQQARVVVGPVRRRLSAPHPGDLGVLVRDLFRQLRAHHLAADRVPERLQAAARSGADPRAGRPDSPASRRASPAHSSSTPSGGASGSLWRSAARRQVSWRCGGSGRPPPSACWWCRR
jgi:Major Facilitator Superfamily